MKRILLVWLSLCFVFGCVSLAFAEEATEPTSSTDSTFDLTEQEEKIKELGIPTTKSVAELKKNADDLWKAEDYAAAAEAYAVYAKQANWLANIISAALEPFYGASYDDRKSFSISSFDKTSKYKLASCETKANSYKSERNRAMLYEGLCYYNLEQYELALPLLIKALDLIAIDDKTNWQLGMNALYDIVGY